MNRYEILKGIVPPPPMKEPEYDFTKPFPGLCSEIIIGGKTFQGHITQLSYQQSQTGLVPQKKGSLILYPSNELAAELSKLVHHEIIFYAHGVQPQKMFVEEIKINEGYENLNMSVEFSGVIS